jgi:hypothetical protein
MRRHLSPRVVAGLAGLALALSIPATASATVNATPNTNAIQAVAPDTTVFVDWFSSFDDCVAVGRDYVHHNGATGFSCRPRSPRGALWVYYP